MSCKMLGTYFTGFKDIHNISRVTFIVLFLKRGEFRALKFTILKNHMKFQLNEIEKCVPFIMLFLPTITTSNFHPHLII